jgi:hypothetical protein
MGIAPSIDGESTSSQCVGGPGLVDSRASAFGTGDAFAGGLSRTQLNLHG